MLPMWILFLVPFQEWSDSSQRYWSPSAKQRSIQLQDFHRSWVWDEDRIKSLIASISRAFPVGALMTLETGGTVNFKPRPIEGTPPEARAVSPQSLLLDGQQRM